jgi:hypothetical protein
MKMKTLLVNESSCTCQECVDMCKTYSCLPTPQEAQRMIDAGFGKKMMLDTRPAVSHPDIKISTLLPAMVGYERKLSPMEIGISSCIFLVCERCQLHAVGMKPLEGRVAIHDKDPEEERIFFNLLKSMWDTPYGHQVVSGWKQKFYLE